MKYHQTNNAWTVEKKINKSFSLYEITWNCWTKVLLVLLILGGFNLLIDHYHCIGMLSDTILGVSLTESCSQLHIYKEEKNNKN